MTQEQMINRLISLEVSAEMLAKECRNTRLLIQAEVSTSADDQQALSDKQKADIISKRRKRQFKSKLKIA